MNYDGLIRLMEHYHGTITRIRQLTLAVSIATAMTLPCIAQHAARTWTSSDGKKTFQATLVSLSETDGTITIRKTNGTSLTFKQALLSQADVDYLKRLSTPSAPPPSPTTSTNNVADKSPTSSDSDDFTFVGEAVVQLLKTGNADAFADALSPMPQDPNDPSIKSGDKPKSPIYTLRSSVKIIAERFLKEAKAWNIDFNQFTLSVVMEAPERNGYMGVELSPGVRGTYVKSKSHIQVVLTATPLPDISNVANQSGEYRVGIESMQKTPEGWKIQAGFNKDGSSNSLRWNSIPKTAVEESLLPKNQKLSIALERIENDSKSPNQGNRKEATQNATDELLALMQEFPSSHDYPQVYTIFNKLLDIAKQSDAKESKRIAQALLDNPQAVSVHRDCAKLITPNSFVAEHHIGKRLDIKFKAIDGREVDLANLRGKVVLLQFWGSWCGPCVAEIPSLFALHEKFHKDGFEIIGICLDESEKRVTDVVKNLGIKWPQRFESKSIIYGEESYIWKFQIDNYPTLWLIDKQGKLSSIRAGQQTEEKIKALLN